MLEDLAAEMLEDWKKAEKYILHYDYEKSSYFIAKLEALTQPKAGGRGGNLPGKPVEAEAMRAAAYDMEHEEYYWLKAVEIMLKTLGERKRIFIKVRQDAEKHAKRCRGRKAWIAFVQTRYSDEIQKRFLLDSGEISERTCRAWWTGIIQKTVEIYLRITRSEKISKSAAV
jgi:hypothetical protein